MVNKDDDDDDLACCCIWDAKKDPDLQLRWVGGCKSVAAFWKTNIIPYFSASEIIILYFSI